jgi:hypothetical protein
MYIADNDIKSNLYGMKTNYFKAWFATQFRRLTPESSLWERMDFIMDDIMRIGQIIAESQDESRKLLMTKGYDVEFDEHLCFAINTIATDSDMLKLLDPKYDILIMFGYVGSSWSHTLYSNKCDVGSIALSHGGGGHAGAAGFLTKDFILGK